MGGGWGYLGEATKQNKTNQQNPQLGGLTFIGVNSTLNSLEAELRFKDVEIV